MALTPVGNIVQGARKIQIFMLLGMMVCVTVGLLAAYIFTTIHYNPLRHIMDMFGHYKVAEDGQKQNEYQWLTEQTLHFLDEHRDIKQRFYDNERIIRSQYLYLLITMPYQAREEMENILEQLQKYIEDRMAAQIFTACGTAFMNNPLDDRVISSKTNVEDAKAYFQSQIQTLCREIHLAEQKKREDSQFGKRVMEYVQQHFQDPDLNISITAMHFNITPSYLSALFKEQTGMGLLEYINKARVEKVKELLEQGMNVIDICDRTGFRSSGALIRVFKKMTGITPGQMKRIKE